MPGTGDEQKRETATLFDTEGIDTMIEGQACNSDPGPGPGPEPEPDLTTSIALTVTLTPSLTLTLTLTRP